MRFVAMKAPFDNMATCLYIDPERRGHRNTLTYLEIAALLSNASNLPLFWIIFYHSLVFSSLFEYSWRCLPHTLSFKKKSDKVPFIFFLKLIFFNFFQGSKEEPGGESFCWSCHKDGSVVKCDTCPRVFHLKCVSLSKDPFKNWICPECSLVLHAETISTRSEAMKSLSLDQLCTLLGFAIERMKNVPEV